MEVYNIFIPPWFEVARFYDKFILYQLFWFCRELGKFNLRIYLFYSDNQLSSSHVYEHIACIKYFISLRWELIPR